MQKVAGSWRRPMGAGLYALVLAAGAAAGWASGAIIVPPVAGDGEDCGAGCGTHDHGMPFFDARRDAQERPNARTSAAIAELKKSAAWTKRQEAAAALRATDRELRIDDHDLLATPHFVRSTARFLTGPSRLSPREVVATYLASQRDLFEIDPAELDKAIVSRDYPTRHNGVRHLTFTQAIGGVPIHECVVKGNVMADGRLINVSSTMIPRPAEGFATPAITLEPLQAIRRAAAAAGVSFTTDPTPREAPKGVTRHQRWNNGPDFRAEQPIETSLIYFPMSREDVRPAWKVVVPVKGVGHTYDIFVDASSGEVLWRHNWLVYMIDPITMNVWTKDSPAPGTPGPSTPDGSQAPFIPRTLVTITEADIMAFSPEGWIPDGTSITSGNNTNTYPDRGNTNVPGLHPDGGPTRTFNFPIDPALDAPNVFTNAATAQLFYYVNRFHDRLYSMGFDEAAGNFQTNNFGRGGVQGDAIFAEAQDGADVGRANNANFATSADGTVSRTQMYVFTGSTPDRDGTLDGDILYHECGHGLSIRLHEATLTITQSRAMGEGWSDFFGSCLNAEPTDDFTQVFTTGGYATFQFPAGAFTNNYYFGIRRFPYSVDLMKNPLTFADTDPAQINVDASIPRSTVIGLTPANQVHNAGEVWCNTLLECRQALSVSHGFGANELIMQLVVDGMKMAPASPTFLQSRDSIIQADLINNMGANRGALWSRFAKRGMGASAVAGDASFNGVVEAFDSPERVNFSYPDGRPTQIMPGVATTLRVVMAPDNLTITPGTAQLFYNVNGGAFTAVPMTGGAGDMYTATIPALSDCFADVAFYPSVNTSIGVQTDPRGAPVGAFVAEVYSSDIVSANDEMETDPGWTITNSPTGGTFTGAWQRVDPVGTVAAPEDDHTPGGTQCWVTQDGPVGGAVGTADVDNGSTTLTSPTYNLGGAGDATVEYWRWYNQNTATTIVDDFVVEASSNNGASWVQAERLVTGAPVPSGWVKATWTLSSIGLTPTSQFRIRFTASDLGTQNITEAGIDDLRVFRRECNVPTCDGDYNDDGAADNSDILDLATDIAAGTQSFPGNNPDFNGDGSADNSDIFDLAQFVASGVCP